MLLPLRNWFDKRPTIIPNDPPASQLGQSIYTYQSINQTDQQIQRSIEYVNSALSILGFVCQQSDPEELSVSCYHPKAEQSYSIPLNQDGTLSPEAISNLFVEIVERNQEIGREEVRAEFCKLMRIKR